MSDQVGNQKAGFLMTLINYFYLFQLLEHLDTRQLPRDELNPHVCRVGWSTDDNSMQLGQYNKYTGIQNKNAGEHDVEI